MSLRVIVNSLCVGWLCLLLILVLEGCQGSKDTPPQAAEKSESAVAEVAPAAGAATTAAADPPEKAETPSAKAAAAPVRKPKPLLEGWAKPAVALVLSGEQHGYIEPCGCSEMQSGGFSRRANLLQQLEEKGWPVVALDLGGTVSAEHSRRQDRIKFETILEGLKKMHYAGLALGREELRLGPDNLLALNTEDLPFVDANVLFFDSPELGRIPSKVIDVNGVKIGVVAVFGTGYKNDVFVGGVDQPIQVTEPAVAVQDALDKLEPQKPDLLVLLSHAKLPESKELAEKFPQFDVVLSAGGPEDPSGKPEMVGKTTLLTVGGKGKKVGVVGFYPQDAEHRLRFELVELDRLRFKHTPQIDDLMRMYQDRLRDEKIVESEKPAAHPSGGEYVGAAKCGECHKKAYNMWKTTGHSRAYESLKTGRKGEEATWISRIHDAECLACHVTGWNPRDVYPYKTGYVSESQSPLLMGQQCENCHGPGSQHVDAELAFKSKRGNQEEVLKWRKAAHLDQKVAKDKLCHECHDPDNSPKFNFEEYWKKVAHPWKD